MPDKVELLASYWTIAGGALPHTDKEYSPFDFKARAESAARAGFKGMGIWHADLFHILETRTLKEMKQILDDNGLEHLELEFLSDWFLEGEQKKQSDIMKKKLLSAAEALGARHLKVGDFLKQITPMPQLIDAFAALCADAANHGTRIVFELMPFAMISTLQDALAMVEGAGAKNGGIAFDLWHIAKLRIPYEEVARVPLKYMLSVEINDGTFEAPWSLHEDTINHRRFCGEGEFDVKGFVAALRKAGYAGPWGIEVLSEELRKKPLEELTTRAFKTTMAQFQS
jgi:sugar phosphate isomerase/epimerase